MEDAHARPLLALFGVLHAVFLPQLGDGGFTEVNKVLERSSVIHWHHGAVCRTCLEVLHFARNGKNSEVSDFLRIYDGCGKNSQNSQRIRVF